MSKGVAKRFYRSSAWADARRKVLLNAGLAGISGLHVHHIKPLDQHPELALDPLNLRPLTQSQHANEHAADYRSQAKQGCDADGWPRGSEHPWNSKIIR